MAVSVRRNLPRRAGGFTLAECLLALGVVSLGLWLAVGLGDSVRRYQGLRRTRGVMATVLRALAAYGESAGDYPRGDAGPASTGALLRHLKTKPASAEILSRLGPDALMRAADGSVVLRDGFGRRMRYLYQPRRAQRPMLLSAGMDPARASDDLRVPLPWGE